MAAPEEPTRHLLLDPDYWRPRLEALRDRPPKVVRIPRDDLARPGVEVVELRLKAHDGAPLRALLARSAFHRAGGEVHLRTCCDFETCALDFRAVERGTSDVVFPFPPGHRLEDRVLDVLRVARTISTVESIEAEAVRLYSGHRTPPDEFRIAELVRDSGWV